MVLCRYFVLLAVAIICKVAAADVDYNGHTVIRVRPDTVQQVQDVKHFLSLHPEFDVWAETKILGNPIDIRVSPTQKEVLVAFLDRHGLKHEVFIQDLQMMLASQRIEISERTRSGMSWDSYYRLDEIYKWMDDVAENNPRIVARIEAGQTYEERPLRGLKISFKEGNPIAFLEAGIHAREWITPATATYFINQILSNKSETIRSYDWHIFPSVNPDGYEYTHTTDRMWRKTRSKHYGVFTGVDANRNWPFHWNEVGSSSFPFTETYAGPSAASEVETQGLKKYLDSVANKTKVYISLHSYSQLLMFPWGYTYDLTAKNDQLMAIGKAGADYIRKNFGTDFTVGPIASTIYAAAGNTIDYAYSKGIPYPFVFELRDQGRYGFLLPPNQILPAAQETFGAVEQMLLEISKRS